MVIPVDEGYHELKLLEKIAAGAEVKRVIPVRFVPMTGEVRKLRSEL